MLDLGQDAWDALRWHQTGETKAIGFYLGQVTESDLPIKQTGSVSVHGDAEVQSTTSVTVYGAGTRSLVPRAKDAPLASFGQEIALRRVVRPNGNTGRSWEIPLGRFRIVRVDGSVEHKRGDTVIDWQTELTLQDRFEAIRADDFLAAEGPQPAATVYGEIRRLSPFPVQTNPALPDRDVPLTTPYESRLGALQTLCQILGGRLGMTRDGVLMPRRVDRWLTDTIDDADFTIDGVIDWQEGMSNDFYNQVSVRSTNDNNIVAYAAITDLSNPLAVGRAGGRTYKHAAPIYETFTAAQKAANTFRDRLANRRSNQIEVTCTPEALLLDVGDFGKVTDTRTGRAVLGEVTDISYPISATAPVQVTLTVAEEI